MWPLTLENIGKCDIAGFFYTDIAIAMYCTFYILTNIHTLWSFEFVLCLHTIPKMSVSKAILLNLLQIHYFWWVYPCKIIGFLHGFETGWGNLYTSCGTSVVSPRVSVANEGDVTEVPQRVNRWPIQLKPCWNPFLTCLSLFS